MIQLIFELSFKVKIHAMILFEFARHLVIIAASIITDSVYSYLCMKTSMIPRIRAYHFSIWWNSSKPYLCLFVCSYYF